MALIDPPAPGRPYAVVAPTGGETLEALDPALIETAYKAHGALLLRGFGADLDAFRRFARSLCPTAVINESPGRAVLDAANAIQGVDGGTSAFALHPELAREPWRPDAALFGCLTPPGQNGSGGGETTLCDGIALAAALPDHVRKGLDGRRLVYIMGVWPELLRFWLGTDAPDDAILANPPHPCPYRFWHMPDGRIAREFSRPALHRPMFAEGPAFGNFLLFARFNNGRGNFPLLDDLTPVPEDWLQAIRATGEALTAEVRWEAGDVLVLDNTRFLHGRRVIGDAGERRIATFFGYLRFAAPDAEELPDAPWRKADFRPPQPPSAQAG
jgi:alpha-ketoglutarate-dependent taurine dioxygenase